MLAVEIEIDVGEVGRRTTVDDHLVENQQTGGRFGRFAGGFVFPQDDAAQTTAKSESCMTCIRSHINPIVKLTYFQLSFMEILVEAVYLRERL